MSHPSPRPLLYAHRGAASEFPENTLPSFRRALEIGVDVLETDLHMTIDGHVIVSHDPTATRMTGAPLRYSQTTLAEIRDLDAGYGFVDADGQRPFAGQGLRVPTLEELLIEFPGVRFNLDLKQSSPPMVDTVLALIARTSSAHRVCLASFSARTILAVRRSGFSGVTSLSQMEMIGFLLLPPTMWRGMCQKLGGIAQLAQIPTHGGPLRLDTRARIDALHSLGLSVAYWTVNDPDEAARLLDLGADGIMTDDPAAIRPVFDARADATAQAAAWP